MRIYRITANRYNVSFTRSIRADSYQDARNKFIIEESRFYSYGTFNNSHSHSHYCGNDDNSKLEIDSIERGRYKL